MVSSKIEKLHKKILIRHHEFPVSYRRVRVKGSESAVNDSGPGSSPICGSHQLFTRAISAILGAKPTHSAMVGACRPCDNGIIAPDDGCGNSSRG